MWWCRFRAGGLWRCVQALTFLGLRATTTYSCPTVLSYPSFGPSKSLSIWVFSCWVNLTLSSDCHRFIWINPCWCLSVSLKLHFQLIVAARELGTYIWVDSALLKSFWGSFGLVLHTLLIGHGIEWFVANAEMRGRDDDYFFLLCISVRGRNPAFCGCTHLLPATHLIRFSLCSVNH